MLRILVSGRRGQGQLKQPSSLRRRLCVSRIFAYSWRSRPTTGRAAAAAAPPRPTDRETRPAGLLVGRQRHISRGFLASPLAQQVRVPWLEAPRSKRGLKRWCSMPRRRRLTPTPRHHRPPPPPSSPVPPPSPGAPSAAPPTSWCSRRCGADTPPSRAPACSTSRRGA